MELPSSGRPIRCELLAAMQEDIKHCSEEGKSTPSPVHKPLFSPTPIASQTSELETRAVLTVDAVRSTLSTPTTTCMTSADPATTASTWQDLPLEQWDNATLASFLEFYSASKQALELCILLRSTLPPLEERASHSACRSTLLTGCQGLLS